MGLDARGTVADGVSTRSVLPPRLRRVLEDGKTRGTIVFVCAEPGMGKDALARILVSRWVDSGAPVLHVDCLGMTGAQAAEAMGELADDIERVERGAKTTMLVLERVPASDEYEVGMQVEALRRMREKGCFVVVFLSPEAVQLPEATPAALRLQSADLLLEIDKERYQELWSLTHGIPVLVDALCDVSVPASPLAGKAFGSAGYCDVLADLVRSSLRESLTNDERHIRLAMLLLGSGSFDELAVACMPPDDGLLDWMEREVPLFEIDMVQGTFACAGVLFHDGLARSCSALASYCTEMSDVTSASARLLAARGDLRRAALVCGLCGQTDRMRLGCEWGVEFVCAGEDALVRHALEEGTRNAASPDRAIELTRYALSLLAEPASHVTRPSPPSSLDDLSVLQRRRWRYLALLEACRGLDMGTMVTDEGLLGAREEDDGLEKALLDHLRARTMLMLGRYEKVHAFLLDNPLRLDPDCLASALLCDDYEIASVMTGAEMTPDDLRAHSRANGLFGHLWSARLRSYHEVLPYLLAVIGGRSKYSDFAKVLACAERMGDSAIRAVVFVAASISDIRVGAFENAHVHALYALDVARSCKLGHMVNSALLVDALVQAHYGDDTYLRHMAVSEHPSAEGDLAALVVLRRDGEASPRLRCLSRMSNPRDVAWLLNVLANDFEHDGLSQAFRERAPRAWRAFSRVVVRKAEAYVKSVGIPSDQAGMVSRRSASPDVRIVDRSSGEPFLHLRLLGGFDLLLDGKSIAGRLNRRMVKPYLLHLGVASNHELSMYEIMESIWPGIDLVGGRQRIYNASCELRRVVGLRAHGKDPLVNNRGEGTIRLDPSVVSVDIDSFARAAYGVLQLADDDRAVMAGAVQVAALYAGNIVATQYDACGLVRSRRDELRELFVDVMVAGAASAMREGSLSRGVRLARRAYELDDLREDVVIALVEVLKCAGRNSEACELYDEYAQRLQRREEKPPSRRLRRLVEDIYYVSRRR